MQRSNSVSTTNSNLIDSPVVPAFLCSTSNKTDDDVFHSNDQDNIVAASRFGDSSMKSKVLRASYRGKAHTKDREKTKSAGERSYSTSSTDNYTKHHSPNAQTKYFITKTDDKIPSSTNHPANYPLDSVLNLTLELEQTSKADVQRRHTISNNEINPLYLNGLTDDENRLNQMETTGQQRSSVITNNDKNDESTTIIENKQASTIEYNRLQNKSINSTTIEYVVHIYFESLVISVFFLTRKFIYFIN